MFFSLSSDYLMGVDFSQPDRVRSLRPSWFPRGNQVIIPFGASAEWLGVSALNGGAECSRKSFFSALPRVAHERKRERGATPNFGRAYPAPLKSSPTRKAWGFGRSYKQKRLPTWGDSKAKGRVELSPLFVNKRGVFAPRILREEKMYLWQ